MFAEQVRRAIAVTPRAKLCELSGALWKAHAAGMVPDDEAQALAEVIQVRKTIPPAPAQPRRAGSRPRSPESMQRRRRWTSNGWLPPQLAARFTMAECAVLSVMSAEVARRGLCRLTLGQIAGMAGVSKTTVRTAMREAKAAGLITIEEWRITAWRNAPNTVRIVSAEWSTWLRMRARKADNRAPAVAKGGGSKLLNPTNTQNYNLSKTGRMKWTDDRRGAKFGPLSSRRPGDNRAAGDPADCLSGHR